MCLRELKQGLCNNLEGWDGEADGREVEEGGETVYLWLIHVDVWQKQTKFCKAIILQFKNKLKKKKERKAGHSQGDTVVHRQNFIPQDTLGSDLKAFQLLATGVP